jgi:pimeloyl-ACP methyl ester carboxylesterase
MDSTQNEWTQAEYKHGLMTIGAHSLFLATAGAPRTPSQPVVVIKAGHCDNSDSWKAVMGAILPFARVYCYDRAGYGQSEVLPTPRTAANITSELSALLNAVGVGAPYIWWDIHVVGC